MDMPAIFKKIWILVRDLYGDYRPRMVALSVLGAMSSLLEGFGISLLVPMFVFFVGGSAVSSSTAVSFLQKLIGGWNIHIDFKVILGVIVALFLLKAFVLFWFGYVRAKTVASYRMDSRKKLYKQFLNADFSFLQKQKVGYLNTVLMNEIKQSSKLFENIIGLLLSLSSSLMYAIVAMFLSPQVTILALLAGALFIFLFKPVIVRIRETSRLLISVGKKVSHMLAEILYGIKAVKTMGVENSVFNKALPLFATFESAEFKKQIAKHVSKISLEPFTIFFILGVFAVSYFYLKFNITAFVAIMYLIHQIFSQVDKVQSALHVMSETVPSATAVLEAMNEVKEHQVKDMGTKQFLFTQSLKFENVRFKYRSSTAQILQSISFEIKKGEAVGVIGPSGAGKTTIVDLLLRLHEAEGGEIRLDSVPIQNVMLADWRKNVVYVPQDVFLMNTTVEENIRFFDSGITKEAVVEASKKANVYDLILSLPQGFETMVGERGTRFSGGERQRIALARALARNPSILILDEATSALDAHAEEIIKDTLNKLKGSVTMIIVAHKPSTIDYTDKVIAIKDGVVIEEGVPSELLRRDNSYFRQIYEKGSALS